MAILRTDARVLPSDELATLRNAVDAATDPRNLGDRSPYHYTFWFALDEAPRNAVEMTVAQRLVHRVPVEVRERAIGVEWWIGRLSPPYADNFEFGVHRDFGEHPQTGKLESPLLSSILYLTTLDDAPLVVFPDQPDLRDARKEFLFPQANLFAMFRGDLWHVVANRRDVIEDETTAAEDRVRLTVLVNWWSFRPSSEAASPMKVVVGDFDGAVFPALC